MSQTTKGKPGFTAECGVLGCNSRTDRKQPGVTFHEIPKRQPLRSMWYDMLGLIDAQDDNNIFVCSLHFAPKLLTRMNHNGVRLQRDAIPTIFPMGHKPNTPKARIRNRHSDKSGLRNKLKKEPNSDTTYQPTILVHKTKSAPMEHSSNQPIQESVPISKSSDPPISDLTNQHTVLVHKTKDVHVIPSSNVTNGPIPALLQPATVQPNRPLMSVINQPVIVLQPNKPLSVINQPVLFQINQTLGPVMSVTDQPVLGYTEQTPFKAYSSDRPSQESVQIFSAVSTMALQLPRCINCNVAIRANQQKYEAIDMNPDIVSIIEEWTTREIADGDVVCEECFDIFIREHEKANEDRSRSTRQFGHQAVCICCGISLSRRTGRRSRPIPIKSAKTTYFKKFIHSDQIPPNARVCNACWQRACYAVKKRHDPVEKDQKDSQLPAQLDALPRPAMNHNSVCDLIKRDPLAPDIPDQSFEDPHITRDHKTKDTLLRVLKQEEKSTAGRSLLKDPLAVEVISQPSRRLQEEDAARRQLAALKGKTHKLQTQNCKYTKQIKALQSKFIRQNERIEALKKTMNELKLQRRHSKAFRENSMAC